MNKLWGNEEVEKQFSKLIENFHKTLPKFEDGRINYSHSNIAPVVTIFVKHGNEILLLKRSQKVGAYKGKWHTVAGYLDELKPIISKVLEEIREEIGVLENSVETVLFLDSIIEEDKTINKKWIVHPVVVTLKSKPQIQLDWEHEEFKWIEPREIESHDTISSLPKLWKILNESL